MARVPKYEVNDYVLFRHYDGQIDFGSIEQVKTLGVLRYRLTGVPIDIYEENIIRVAIPEDFDNYKLSDTDEIDRLLLHEMRGLWPGSI